MVGRAVVSLVMMLMLALLLSQVFPGKRAALVTPSTATMTWRTPSSATPRSFEEVTDFSTCLEIERQLTAQRDTRDGALTLSCHRTRLPWVPL